MYNVANGCRTLMIELYNLSKKSRLDEHILLPEEVSMILKLDLQDTREIVDYLEESGYIKCGRPVGKEYSWVKLSTDGMRLIQDDSAFERAFLHLDPSISQTTASNRASYKLEIEVDQIVMEIINRHGLEKSSNPLASQDDINHSLYLVVESVRQNNIQPLKEFLSQLILQGGVNTTVVGVKALLDVCGVDSTYLDGHVYP